jgi:hypothetical protein
MLQYLGRSSEWPFFVSVGFLSRTKRHSQLLPENAVVSKSGRLHPTHANRYLSRLRP